MGRYDRERFIVCIAIFNDRNARPIRLTEAWNCFMRNKDGMGLLWADESGLRVHKQLSDFPSFYKHYEALREQDVGNILLHFRIGTQGPNNLDNCHPFVVNDNFGFIHNGVLRDYTKTFEGDQRSDTRIFARKILQKLPRTWLGNHVLRELIQDKIGFNNKLVFMSRKGFVYIFNEEKGHWHDKNWFSNDTYEHKPYGRIYCGDDVGKPSPSSLPGVGYQRGHHGYKPTVEQSKFLDRDREMKANLALVKSGEEFMTPELGWIHGGQYFCWDCLKEAGRTTLIKAMVTAECFQECAKCKVALGDGKMSWDDMPNDSDGWAGKEWMQ